MLDSNVFDELLVRQDVAGKLRTLVEQGKVALLSTRVQREQLGETPDEAKRERLLELFDSLPLTPISTVGFWDVDFRWDVNRWAAEDFDSVLRTPASGTKDGQPGHTADALIAHAARDGEAVLVTHESGPGGRMLKAPPRAGIETWHTSRFFAWVLAQA